MDTSEQQSPPNEPSNMMSQGQDYSGSEGQNLVYPNDSQQQGGTSGYIMESNAEYEEGEEEGYYPEDGEEMEGHEAYGYEEGEEEEEMYENQENMNQMEESHGEQEYQVEENGIPGNNLQASQGGLQRSVSGDGKNQDESQESQIKKISYDGEDADIEELFAEDFDLIKKIRKMLLNNINKERINHDLHYLSIDIITNIIATEYANHLKNNSHEPNTFQIISEQKHNIGEISLIYLKSQFEEDVFVDEKVLMDNFEEVGLILLESTEEKQVLLDPNATHIGLGIAAMNEGIAVVQIVSQKMITIRRIQEGEEGGIEVRGTMLDDKYGIFAARVLNVDTNKDVLQVGPEKIDFDRKSKDFILYLNIERQFIGQRNIVIEYYVRTNPDSIPYRKQTRDKLKLKENKLELRSPCIIFPDLKMMDIEEVDKPYISLTAEKIVRKEIASPKRKTETPNMEKRGDENLENDKKNEENKDSIDAPSKIMASPNIDNNEEKVKRIAFEQAKEQAISNKEIKEELEISLAEAQKQYDELLQQNTLLQEKIKTLKNKNDVIVDRQGDVAMNEHKYLNTLAHVHQIRLDLKQTQDKYNKMAADLQKKLEEKQKKCNEIKMTFMELKREVARKAAFTRTDKPIPEKMIDEWEERELEKNKILQELRLDILRLRNNLAKNKKILKKKEELAEGLHLIDFEQLKIENQTLNEKIEERNEDLHKLKKKNTTTVQILTHTREKLGFVQKKNDELEKIGKDKEGDLGKKRKELSRLKKAKDTFRKTNLTLKQQSGILNSDNLRKDFQFIKSNIEKLKTLRDELKSKKEEMEKAIKDYYKAQGKTFALSKK